MRACLVASALCLVGCIGWRGAAPVVVPSPPEGQPKPRATFSLRACTTQPARWHDESREPRQWIEAPTSADPQPPWVQLVAGAMMDTGWFEAVTPITASGERSPAMHFDFDLQLQQEEYVMLPVTGVLVPVDVCVLVLDLFLSLWPQRLDHTIEFRAVAHAAGGAGTSSSKETTGRLVALWLLPALPFATLAPDDEAVRDAVRTAVRSTIQLGLFPVSTR